MTKKNKPLKVGLVGCGAIGVSLARILVKKFSAHAVLHGVCDHHEQNRKNLIRALKRPCREMSFDQILQSSQLIIEAASQEAAFELLTGKNVRGKTFLIMSVGGILKALEKHPRLLKNFPGQILVPSGAIAGIDGLLAAREAGLSRVLLRTRKPPKGLKQAPYFSKHPFPDLKKNQEKCVFRGTASKAVKNFPQNINVAALLSLAGMGPVRTQVEIWTSPAYTGNRHEILIQHARGQIQVSVDNQPAPDNPKTSYLAITAAAACLQKFFDPLKTGT